MADHWHRRLLEGKGALFAVLTTAAVLVGTVVEIVPMFSATAGPASMDGIEPYTPLELAGRDIYIREGCYLCHSQMVRPFRAETMRYGPWSRAGEYKWDRPFLLGSRRIGPDLARIGGKYPDAWHYEHMDDPRSTSPGSRMPSYPWLLEWELDPADVQATVQAMSTLGTPYQSTDLASVEASMDEQAEAIVGRLKQADIDDAEPDKEIIALIAYLQKLGVDGRAVIEERRQTAMNEGGEL